MNFSFFFWIKMFSNAQQKARFHDQIIVVIRSEVVTSNRRDQTWVICFSPFIGWLWETMWHDSKNIPGVGMVEFCILLKLCTVSLYLVGSFKKNKHICPVLWSSDNRCHLCSDNPCRGQLFWKAINVNLGPGGILEKVACLNWIEPNLETCTPVTSNLPGEGWLLTRANTVFKSEFSERFTLRADFPSSRWWEKAWNG